MLPKSVCCTHTLLCFCVSVSLFADPGILTANVDIYFKSWASQQMSLYMQRSLGIGSGLFATNTQRNTCV